jgi:polysaccharide export outer membrane protein
MRDVAHPTFRLPVSLLLALTGLLAAQGCGRVVQARRMPARYQAAGVSNAKVADLGRLSMPTASNSLIGAEDVIDIVIASGLESGTQLAPTPVRVGDDGVATIALVGPVPVAGLEPFAAEQRIAAAAIERGLYRSPQVTVTIRKKAVNHVTVIGAVAKQGVQELPKGQSTLLAALVSAGALSERAGTTIEITRHPRSGGLATRDASEANVAGDAEGLESDTDRGVVPAQLLRPPGGVRGLPPILSRPVAATTPPQTISIDLADIDTAGSNDLALEDGDIVRVETRDPLPVSVIGLVHKPGQYPMPIGKPMRVLDALAMAGERSNNWADKILITRHLDSESRPVVIQTSVWAAQREDESNILLSPGDVVSVEQTPATVMNTLIGNVLRFSFVAGGRMAVF